MLDEIQDLKYSFIHNTHIQDVTLGSTPEPLEDKSYVLSLNIDRSFIRFSIY